MGRAHAWAQAAVFALARSMPPSSMHALASCSPSSSSSSSLSSSLPLPRLWYGRPSTFDFDVENVTELARQLAVRDCHAFSRVRAKELLKGEWASENRATACPNVVRATRHFNNMVTWAEHIVLLSKDDRARAIRIGKLIRIADKCRQIRSFPSCYAIFMALSSQRCDTSRLTKTWALVPKATMAMFETYQSLFNVAQNSREFRTELVRSKRPAVEENMKNRTKEGLLNFQKMRLLAKTIGHLKQFQVQGFHYPRLEYMQAYFDKTLETLPSEDALMKLSHAAEPPT
eukprot:g34490.t1